MTIGCRREDSRHDASRSRPTCSTRRAGSPRAGVRVELARERASRRRLRRDGRRRPDRRARRRTSSPGRYALVFWPPSPFFTRVELEVELDDGPPPRPAPRLAVRMRELPRKLSVDELAELFEGRTRLVERLAEIEDPLERADDVLATLSDEDKVEALERASRDRPADGALRALGRRAGRRRRPVRARRARRA